MKKFCLFFVLAVIFTVSGIFAASEVTDESVISEQFQTYCNDPNFNVDLNENEFAYERWKERVGDRGPFSFEQLHIKGTDIKSTSSNRIMIIINSDLNSSISTELMQYYGDLMNDGYSLFGALTSGGTPQELKDTITAVYNNLGDVLGVVLIGDLPVAWYEYYYVYNVTDTIDDTTIVTYEDSTYVSIPVEQYFQDMDGIWLDNDGNGAFDDAYGDLKPEIWYGRIDAHLCNCNGETEVELMQNYFRKNHLYRIGQLELNNRALAYFGPSYQIWGHIERTPRILREVYPDVAVALADTSTNKSGFLDSIQQNYEFVHPHGHGGIMGSDGCSVAAVDPKAHFYTIFGCGSGNFTRENTAALWYIFSPSYGLACAAYASGGGCCGDVFYETLANNGTYGQAFLDVQQSLESVSYNVLLGDPTLHTNYCDPALGDADGDGHADDCDNCPEISNSDQLDIDVDYMGDICDTCIDSDYDGYGDPGYLANVCPDDNCPYVYNLDQADTDEDGIGDKCDTCTDTDGDGYGDPGFDENICQTDNCPDTYNPDQIDSDGDGVGDLCDNCPYDPLDDIDGDGLCADVDNCPYVYNPAQEDGDGNSEGDSCDCYIQDDTTWSRKIDMSPMDALYSIMQISDGSYIAVGQVGDSLPSPFAARFNSCGQFIWYDYYGSSAGSANSIRSTSDGGYIIGGTAYSTYFASKLDSDFNEEWSWFFIGSDLYGQAAVEESDGFYLLAGYFSNAATLCKFEPGAGILADIDGFSDSGAAFFDIVKATDGNYLAVGNTINASDQKAVYVVKVDGDMNLIWEKEIPPYYNSEEVAYAVINTHDGGCVVAGVRDNIDGTSNCLVSKVSSTGTHVWTNTYGDTGDDEAYAIHIADDNGFIIAGHSNSNRNDYDPYIVITDSNGSILQQFWVSEDGDQKIYGMDITLDDHIILAGESDGDYYLAKIDIPTPSFMCGDVNADDDINVGDITYLVDYMFKGGPAPIPLESGDVDCQPGINVSDLVWLVDFVFRGGPEPCEC